MDSKNFENVWALKIMRADTAEEEGTLINEALNYYGQKFAAICNDTVIADMPFLCAAMQLVASAAKSALGEYGQKAVDELVAACTTITIDVGGIGGNEK